MTLTIIKTYVYNETTNKELNKNIITMTKQDKINLLANIYEKNENKLINILKMEDIEKKMEAARRKVDKNLTLGMTKREVQALQKMLNRVLYNVAEP